MTTDPIEEALKFVEGPGREFHCVGTSTTILAAEVRRLREVEKQLTARLDQAQHELHTAMRRENRSEHIPAHRGRRVHDAD